MSSFKIQKKSTIILIFFCELIVCKRIVPSSTLKHNKKLDDCRRCKVLTDSFSYWLEKTSRGKYEGGDAAWEKSKLRSYSRSEIRLVEIQEGLCSELNVHQDPCYSLAEESEQVLENWWFRDDPNSLDLYTWLCIDTLQYCCPRGHFGNACTRCPHNKSNEVCSKNGRCDGEGTRNGNGTCLCKTGYTGTLCDECAKNFYSSTSETCLACHKSCYGCTGEGVAACEACNTGWTLQSGMCVDIDECSSLLCQSNEYCVNNEGSYTCKACDLSCKTCDGEGTTKCTSCDAKQELWSSMCVNDDLKQSILNSAFKRFSLYVGLIVMALFIFHTSISLASVVVLTIAIYIYVSEKSANMTLLDVGVNLISASS